VVAINTFGIAPPHLVTIIMFLIPKGFYKSTKLAYINVFDG
jgi:hypothetical protein